MKKIHLFFMIALLLSSCASKNQVLYLQDVESESTKVIKNLLLSTKVKMGDVLGINVLSNSIDASMPYNLNNIESTENGNINSKGYLVNNLSEIHFPILGVINVGGLTISEIEEKIEKLLIEGNHLVAPKVHIEIINLKFTVLGDVKNPGTFDFKNNLNIFQALGYSNDLSITADRRNIVLLREENGLRKVYKFSITDSNIFNQPYYQIRNNDVVIVHPNFSKVKSAGFIGSPASIANIASLILSVTLLIINK